MLHMKEAPTCGLRLIDTVSADQLANRNQVSYSVAQDTPEMTDSKSAVLHAHLASHLHCNPVSAPRHYLLHLLQLAPAHHLPTGDCITSDCLCDTDAAAQAPGTALCSGGGNLGAVQQLGGDQVDSTLLIPAGAISHDRCCSSARHKPQNRGDGDASRSSQHKEIPLTESFDICSDLQNTAQ